MVHVGPFGIPEMDPHFGDNLEATGKAIYIFFSSLIGTFTSLKTNEYP